MNISIKHLVVANSIISYVAIIIGVVGFGFGIGAYIQVRNPSSPIVRDVAGDWELSGSFMLGPLLENGTDPSNAINTHSYNVIITTYNREFFIINLPAANRPSHPTSGNHDPAPMTFDERWLCKFEHESSKFFCTDENEPVVMIGSFSSRNSLSYAYIESGNNVNKLAIGEVFGTRV